MRPDCRPRRETLGTPSPADWTCFREWSRQEGWRVPTRELALYRGELSDSATVLRDPEGVPLGFVTVCRHQRSAWIGNLLVDPAQRGQGFGRQLFAHAVGTLSALGINALWLTASAAGRPLYETYGFRAAGRVERWVWSGVGGGVATAATGNLHALVRADAAAWGDSRVGLLSRLARGGQIVASGSTVALLQKGDGLMVLGPWLSADLCPRSNRAVLATALEACPAAGEIAVDLIGGSPVRRLLQASGFSQTGETLLMLRGEPGKVKYGEIVALASLGSMG